MRDKILLLLARLIVFLRDQFLRVFRSPPVLWVRRRTTAFDQFVFDATRVYFQTWFRQDNSWPPPRPWVLLKGFRARRRALLKRLREVAARMSVSIHVVSAARLGKNILGEYVHGGVAPHINLLDVRQDDPWVLAHELGHHFAITFRDDKREAAADEEARKLVAAASDPSLQRLSHVRLLATGYRWTSSSRTPSTLLGLFALGASFAWVNSWWSSITINVAIFYSFLSLMTGFGSTLVRVDPESPPQQKTRPPSKYEVRLTKLRNLAQDPRTNSNERDSALAEIRRMQTRRNAS